MKNGFAIIYTLAKPLENSHMMLEESQDLENKESQLKKQVNEMCGSM
jgi:hypothetical protein